MSGVGGLITDEPALITGLVSAILILAVAFGVPVSDDQRNAILGLFAAGTALVGSLILRSAVTPNAHVDAIVRTVQAPVVTDTPAAVPAP